MPKPYPQGFCDDVVLVARNREHGVRIEQIIMRTNVALAA